MPKNEFTLAPVAHREEVVEPDEIRQDGDHHRGVDHRGVAEEALARERRGDFREDAEGRQDQDVDLRMAPDPDEVEVHHRVAAEIVREEVRSHVAVERQQGQDGGQHREGRDDQHVGAERGPAEDRHLHHGHAGGAHLHDGGDEVDAREQRADTRDLQRPDVVVDAHAGAVGRFRQRREGEPARARKLADEQRSHHDDGATDRHPEREIVEEREGHVAGADLQRHHEVHQPRHEGHGHEEDHDDAVRREHLVVMVRRQVTLVLTEGDRLLRAHQQRIREAAQQHHDGEHDVHDADLLVIDAREPLGPEIAPDLEVGQGTEEREPAERDRDEGRDEDRLVIGDRLQREAPEDKVLEIQVREHCGLPVRDLVTVRLSSCPIAPGPDFHPSCPACLACCGPDPGRAGSSAG